MYIEYPYVRTKRLMKLATAAKRLYKVVALIKSFYKGMLNHVFYSPVMLA